VTLRSGQPAPTAFDGSTGRMPVLDAIGNTPLVRVMRLVTADSGLKYLGGESYR